MLSAQERYSNHSPAALHPATEMGAVTLKVADLARALSFYTGAIGLQPLRQEDRSAILGAGRRPIVALEEIPGARPQPAHTTGLYHAAILFPDRKSLAIKIAQLSAMRIPLGQSDHLVSEAFYLSDPDGNGLELYRDRPRSEWGWENGRVRMAIDPIDFNSFFGAMAGVDPATASPEAPQGTKLGHMHLRVADLDLAQQFYAGVLGFEVTARLPGALFVSAGGYHHHIGMNTWESRGGKPPAEPSAGLREFSIALPDAGELERLVRQIESSGAAIERAGDSALVLDPFQNRIRLILPAQLL